MACWPVQPLRPNSTPAPGWTSSSARWSDARCSVPRSQAACAPLGRRRAHVVVDVEAVAVVDLDPLDAQPQDPFDLLAPPALGLGAGEVDRGAGAHPPLVQIRLTRGCPDEAALGAFGVVGGRLTVQPSDSA